MALAFGLFFMPCEAQVISGYSELSDSDVMKTLKSHVSYLASDELGVVVVVFDSENIDDRFVGRKAGQLFEHRIPVRGKCLVDLSGAHLGHILITSRRQRSS